MAFEFPIHIYWEDTDAGGIVYYANYLRFFERARTEWLRAAGIHQRTMREQTGGMFVVAEASLKYLRPARLEDELIVTVQLQEAGRAGLLMAQQVLLTEPGTAARTLLCEGSVRAAWVDAQTLKPKRLPSDILQKLNP
ncbi:MAG: tol-pal system-associated acyl-CoA thioesterase [Pseudomonadota bacterium]|nr:tol-pal system-associated acyl-CoA thioesterase [Pseudomonadota bacterium]